MKRFSVIALVLTICLVPLVGCGSSPRYDAIDRRIDKLITASENQQTENKAIREEIKASQNALREEIKADLKKSLDAVGVHINGGSTGTGSSSGKDCAKKISARADGFRSRQEMLDQDRLKFQEELKELKEVIDKHLPSGGLSSARPLTEAEERTYLALVDQRLPPSPNKGKWRRVAIPPNSLYMYWVLVGDKVWARTI